MPEFRKLFSAIWLFAALAYAQSTHNLPATLAAPSAAITTILTGLNGSGGIVADNAGWVTVAETPQSRTWRIPPGGAKVQLPSANGLTIRGLVYDRKGRMLFVQDNKLSYFDAAATIHDLATQRSGGGALGHNNDLVALDDGSVYFTNGDGNTIFYWKEGADPIVAASGLNYPDGIEANESAGKVYVTLYSQPYALASFDIQGDHTLANKQVLATIGVPDGLVLDAQGNFYVTSLTEACVAVYSPAGKELGRINVPGENIHNAGFGGIGNDTLYFTGEHASFKMGMKVKGQRNPFGPVSGLFFRSAGPAVAGGNSVLGWAGSAGWVTSEFRGAGKSGSRFNAVGRVLVLR